MAATVESQPSNLPPDAPTKVVVSTKTSFVILSDDAGKAVPAFNQGDPRWASVRLPIQDPTSKTVRTIQSSGCGMCSWVSALAAAGCRAPSYDRHAKTFAAPADAALIDPGSFNQYLLDVCHSKATDDAGITKNIHAVYNTPDGGALINESALLATAVNALLSLAHALPTSEAGFTSAAGGANAKTGDEVAALTGQLDAGNPCLLAVGFTGTSKGDHQVLAVGYVRSGKSVYYLIVDPGFDPTSPYSILGLRGKAFALGDVVRFCASTSHGQPMAGVIRFRALLGLQTFTGLKAVTSS